MTYTMLVILVFGIVFSSTVLAAMDSSCTAFAINSRHPSTFAYYRFYDFRNISSTESKHKQKHADSPSTSSYRAIHDADWTEDWYLRDTPRNSPGGSVITGHFKPERVNTVNAPKGAGYSTYLSMTTAHLTSNYQEGGEITYTEHDISYASIRISARINGASGAVFGFFTYYDDDTESDIEIRTQDPSNMIHYSNQPASTGEPDWLPIPGATVNRSMPSKGKWTDWHVHRLDWLPNMSAFYVDDVQMNETTTNVPLPIPESRVYVDIFSQNSSWTGPMDVGKSAEVQIQWIELLFNSTSVPAGAQKVGKVCKVGSKGSSKRSVASLGVASSGLASSMLVSGLTLGFLYFIVA